MIATLIKWLCKITGTWKTCHAHFCYKDNRWEPEHQNCRCELVEYKTQIDEMIIDSIEFKCEPCLIGMTFLVKFEESGPTYDYIIWDTVTLVRYTWWRKVIATVRGYFINLFRRRL